MTCPGPVVVRFSQPRRQPPAVEALVHAADPQEHLGPGPRAQAWPAVQGEAAHLGQVRVGRRARGPLFWSTVISSAAGLFPQRVRGRAVSLIFAGNALATLLGVPLGTWMGQHFGWRSPFGALSCLAPLTMLAVASGLRRRPSPGRAGLGRMGAPMAAMLSALGRISQEDRQVSGLCAVLDPDTPRPSQPGFLVRFSQ